MRRHDFDVLFCHWPLLGFLFWYFSKPEDANLARNAFGYATIAIISGGYLVAIVYAFFRVSHQKWPAGRVIAWVMGLLWLQPISLPWLYWGYLRHQDSV